MRRLIFFAFVGILFALGGWAVAATLDTVTSPFTFHVDQTVTNDDGSTAHLQGDLTVDVAIPVPPPPASPACSDGIDNDGDGLTDFPADPGCQDATDTGEFNPPPAAACSDTVDNDGDGLIDFPADPGCTDANDTSEANSAPVAQCDDGIDNDGDGLVDNADPGCSSASDNDETNSGGGGGGTTGTVNLTNAKYTCRGQVNLDLVKVTIDSSHFVTPAVQIASGCTGTIARIEIVNANGDGIHVGAFAHDLTVNGGYVRSPLGGCTLCGPLHVDGIQVMGGQRLTFNNMEVNYQTATNATLYINQGSGGQDRPTDVVFNNSTFRRSPTRNRVVRIGDSLRSGIRNSIVYWCGTGSSCDSNAAAIWGNGLATKPIGVTYNPVPASCTGETDPDDNPCGSSFTGPTPDNTLILNG